MLIMGEQDEPHSTQPSESPKENVILLDKDLALQTGPDVGPTFAGGMHYDSTSNSVYVTGATYGSFGVEPGESPKDRSSCFVGVWNLDSMEWSALEIYGTASAEACNDISLTIYHKYPTAIVIGSTSESGLLTQFAAGRQKVRSGFALDIVHRQDKLELQGGTLMETSLVQVPVTMTTDNKGNVWTVSVATDSQGTGRAYKDLLKTDFPNLTSGGIESYTFKHTVVMEGFSLQRPNQATEDSLKNTLISNWVETLDTKKDERILLSDMILVSGHRDLILVGTSYASSIRKDTDGYIMKRSASTGQPHSDSVVFLDGGDQDDWIMGVCTSPHDATTFFVVGATAGSHNEHSREEGDVTVHALVAKLQVSNLSTQWVRQFPVTHADGTTTRRAAAAAYGCAVVGDRTGVVYVAGVVENGATMTKAETTSAGRDDIFVARIEDRDGHVDWIRQVGSNGDDHIARNGGIQADAAGNAVVFGDTNGSLFRSRAGDADVNEVFSDIFIMSFDREDGSHRSPLEEDNSDLPAETSTPHQWFPTPPPGTSGNPSSDVRSNIRLSLVIGLLLLALFLYVYGRRHARKLAERRDESIFGYLVQFDVEDIELTKSPTGGWHVTYLNLLAHGIHQTRNRQKKVEQTGGSFEMATRSRVNVVSDSLFVDPGATPSLGYRHQGSGNAYFA